jgi:tRNA 2-selenouridine synthase
METAPVVLLEASDEERIEITLQEYVTDALAEFQADRGIEAGFGAWADYLRSSMDRIRRRLGGDRHAQVRRLLEDAVARHAGTGDIGAHRAWIGYLLHEYYDGMYEYQLERKADRIVFAGPQDAVLAYLRENHGIDHTA